MIGLKRILIVNKMHHSIEPMLQELGWTIDYQPSINRAEILRIIPNYSGLIIRSKTVIDEELVERGKHLKFVARAGAGVDQIDIQAIEKKGIKLINAPEGNRNALGEYTLGLLLS